MPTDEERGSGPVRTGPRHAAPRKHLLSRLHMPAGKAVALAAMPSAVLMGMGLTPQLAQAKPTPASPFEGACATVPDHSPEPDAGEGEDGREGEGTKDKAADGDARDSTPAEDTAEKDGKGAQDGKAGKAGEEDKAGTGTGGKAGTSGKAGDGTGKAGRLPAPPAAPSSPSASPSPSASASKSVNPLDPLGLGDALKDVLTGGAKPGTKPSSPGASPAPSAPKPSATGGGKESGKAGRPAARPSGSGDPSADPSAARSPSASPSGSASASPSGSASPSASASAKDGALPPCPAPQVVDEKEKHAFPVNPWFLESDKLTLGGLTYQGIKKITMVNGQEKSVLKFTADSVGIGDLHQIVNVEGRQYHVAGRGTTSTIRGGQVTMYTESLKGKLLGLLPADYSATSPPPMLPGLKLPVPIFFTGVKIRQGGQFGGTLHIPNLHLYVTEGTYPQ